MTGRLRKPTATSGLPLVGLAAAAGAAWTPVLWRPVSPDEGGFLIVASQWHPGRSLYGDYWVDRPPMLIALHALADMFGGLPALRTIGLLAVVATVLLAGACARAVAPNSRRRPGVPALVAAALVVSPLLGSTEVAGELLTTPVVLAGLLCLCRALTSGAPRSRTAWASAAGALGAAAPLIKQNAVDVAVAAVVVLVPLLQRRRRDAVRIAAAVAVGAAVTVAVVLAAAATRGTEPGPLFQAVVTFRLHAGQLLQQRQPTADAVRLRRLVQFGALSGLPLLWAALGWRTRAPLAPDAVLPDLRWAAIALLAWEAVAVSGGGSYWLHYLLDLVPGTVLLALAASQPRSDAARPRAMWSERAVRASVAVTLTVSAASLAAAAVTPRETSSDKVVVAYLNHHARPGDTATVAFGHADILYASDLRSPYVNMWSLPARVRDPQLTVLRALLRSRRAPTWLVLPGTDLRHWGSGAKGAQRTLHRRYVLVDQVAATQVWRHRSTT